MEKWDSKDWEIMEINENVWKKAIEVQQNLGELDVYMSSVFPEPKMSSRIFAFIESKYSSRIEGIFTTLFENVNTGILKEKDKLIKPIVNALFKERDIITTSDINEIEGILNQGIDREKRWDKSFGIYSQVGNKEEKIYEPSLNKDEVDNLMRGIFNKIKKDSNLVDIIITHIIFEKIHPFVDANGRMGRLILQKQLINTMTFSKIVPLSWSIYKNNALYYDALSNAKKDINKSILSFLEIIKKFIETTKDFIQNLDKFYIDNKEKILSYSNKINEPIAKEILFSLQTKKNFLEKKYGWNPRTIDKVFEHIMNQDLDFNIKTVSKKKLFWNIELETLIDTHFC